LTEQEERGFPLSLYSVRPSRKRGKFLSLYAVEPNREGGEQCPWFTRFWPGEEKWKALNEESTNTIISHHKTM